MLSQFERQGAVPVRQLLDLARRKGRLTGDPQQMQAALVAALRADNVRRSAAQMRPRFRFANGRVGLTDWLLDGETRRAEQELIAAVERYRDASRRALLRHMQQLPPRAFGDLVLVLLERLGVRDIDVVRPRGASGNELHLSGRAVTVTAEQQTAIIVRRDGRDVGRERVNELRGSLHHYGTATAGWILTTGQVLSGAREEAAAAGASPIRLFDGAGLARLCEEQDVGVSRSRFTITLPDAELFEALRLG
jgi:restriction endonuclease Mrr